LTDCKLTRRQRNLADLIELLREIMTLTSDVGGLKARLEKVADEVDSLRERIVRLEAREEVIVEKTHSAAVMAVDRMHKDVLERLIRLEQAGSSAKKLANGE
jgi:regulator of replication initiation timing